MHKALSLLFFILSLGSSYSFATTSSLVEEIKNAIGPQIGSTTMGAVIGVYEKGETHFISFGKKGNDLPAPNKDTLFELASITKTFTSLLFAIAIEKKLVTTDTTLSMIRPEWAGQKLGRIKLLDLATHRSGLTRLPCDFFYNDSKNPYIDYTEGHLIRSITDAIISSSNECNIRENAFLYSNWGSALLGHAIAYRAGSSYEELLKNWITTPLGMKNTIIRMTEEQSLKLAQGHTEDHVPTGVWDKSGMYGNGSIISSPADLMIYAKAMLYPDSTPLKAAILRVQRSQYSDIALNWFVTPGGNIWHNGMSGGYSSLIKVYLKRDKAVFYLSNSAVELKGLIEAADRSLGL